jgi:hypothetical protein
MKNILFLAIAALFLSCASYAQSTADSIEAKYKLLPMPEAGTIEKTFPILGTYQLNAADNTSGNIVISLDSVNKGIVWIDGLPEGRIKAYLKQSPATYRIIAQKSEIGRQVPEGTLLFNPETNTLNISLGAPYNEADPSGIFAMNNANTGVATDTPKNVKIKTKTAYSKSKSRVMYYTASKTLTTSSSNAAQQ